MSYYDNDDFDDYDSYEDQNSTVDDISDIYDDYQNIKEKINSNKNSLDNDYAKNPNKSSGNVHNVNKNAPNNSNVSKATSASQSGAKAANTASKGTQAADAASKGAKAADTASKGAKAAKAGKTAATAGKAAATAGEAASGPVGWIILGADVLLSSFRRIKQKRKEEKENPAKRQKSIEKKSKIAIILASPFLIPIGLLFICGMGLTIAQNVTTVNSTARVNDYVTCMQSDELCEDVGDYKLDQKIQGFNKPLIALNRMELRTLAEGYADFSEKYFKNGEGVADYNKPSIEKAFGIEGANILDKRALDMVMLINCFSIEAQAFSKISWTEVWYDRNTDKLNSRTLDKEEDFTYFYKSTDDHSDSSDISEYFNWFSGKDYEIKIPNVEKYSKSKTEYRSVATSATFDKAEADVTKEEIDGVVAGNPDDDKNPEITETPTKIDDEFKMKELKRYYELVKDYLPRWYEIYAFYLNCGSMEATKDFYNSYLTGEFSGISIKLLKIDDYNESESKTIKETTTETSYPDSEDEPTENKSTTVTTIRSSTRIQGYATMVVSGANAWHYKLVDDPNARLELTTDKTKTVSRNKKSTKGPMTNTNKIDTDGDDKPDKTIVNVVTIKSNELYSKTITFGSGTKMGIHLPSCGNEVEDEFDEEAKAAKDKELEDLVDAWADQMDQGINPYAGTSMEDPFAGTPLEGGPNAGNPGDSGKPSDWVRNNSEYRQAAKDYFRSVLEGEKDSGCAQPIYIYYHDLFSTYKYGNNGSEYVEMRFMAVLKNYYEYAGKLFNPTEFSTAIDVVCQYYKSEEQSKKKVSTTSGMSLPSGMTSEDDPSVTSDPGNGYSEKHEASNGKLYRSYKQNSGDYAGYSYLDHTFGQWGCPITTAAIMLDVLGIHVENPYAVYEVTGAQTPDNAINIYTGKALYTFDASPNKNKIIEWVEKGYPVGIHVGTGGSDGSAQHYMVVTNYNSKTGQFYVEGVHTAYDSAHISGWLNYEDIREISTDDGINKIFIPTSEF